jgi:hypothetical protein
MTRTLLAVLTFVFCGQARAGAPDGIPRELAREVRHAFRTCDTNYPSNSRRMRRRREEVNNSNLFFAMRARFY